MSFQSGLSGLNAASKNLSVIGNNVANASTAGFKGARAQFADVFATTVAGSGSTPIGIGVNVADVSQLFSQGNITITNNPLDIAISGEGFLRVVVNEAGDVQYTRNGQMQLDRDGFLVNSAGHFVTGWPRDPVSGVIQTGSQPERIQVTNTDMDPRPTGAGSPPGVVGVQVGLNLDSRVTARAAAPAYTAPATGGIPVSQFDSTTAVTIYDSLGNSHVMSMYYRRVDNPTTGASRWDVYAYVNGDRIGAGGPVGSLEFDTSGTLVSGATSAIAIPAATLGSGAAALSFDLSHEGSTQFGARFAVNSLSQDGYTSGQLSGFSISPNGMVLGRYSNGQSREQGQIVLASFRNVQGLAPVGNNNFVETFDSNQPLINEPGAGSLGLIRSGALEDANVDLTQELVNMITAQRAYQANAQTIKTQDAVLQTLVNLR